MQWVITGDGSHTFYVPGLDEHYHSTHGAVAESMHVFIRNGLSHLTAARLTVFEVGLGTGLNALLTALAAIERNISVTYYAIENNPVDPGITEKLNYPDLLSKAGNESHDIFRAIHQAPWEQLTRIHSCFCLYKIQGDIHDFKPHFNYDLVYYDAFAPEKQPDMWTPELLHRLIIHLNQGGIFTTYCAKGSVRRLLKENGLMVERLPGPPGKREMLRGVKRVTGDK
jgi:tRNA U34 5-methylaminomethyl-2-thiouridine-forming methyltransferase MnmC